MMNAGFTLIILPIIIRLSFSQQMILIVALWLSFHRRMPGVPRIMRKLWSNLQSKHATNFREELADLRERTDYPSGKRTEDMSRERGIESEWRAAAQRACRDQEDATDPMVAPPDYDVRQSGRILELQSSDLCCDQQICLGTFLSS